MSTADAQPRQVEGGLQIAATGNLVKHSTVHDQYLTVTGGEGNMVNPWDGPEVHLKFEGCCGDRAEGWFFVADLKAAIAAAEEAGDE